MEDLVADLPFPDWAKDAVLRAPYVVVRRAGSYSGLVPVGLRGEQRGQRMSYWLPENLIEEVITPYALTDKDNWKAVYPAAVPETVNTLGLISSILHQTGYQWGPTGSTGFELATGLPTIKESSDLDLVIEVPGILNVETAKILLDRMEDISTVRLDIQISTVKGGFSLKEYTNSPTVLVKTSLGPLLMDHTTLWG
jgi:phosphoribosyl-dephospho-CoA transferase